MAEAPRVDAAARLWWGARRYAWLIVVILVAFAAFAANAGAALTGETDRFRATSLVVATDLQIRAEQLPRFATTLFRAGTVARETATRAGVDVSADDLIPGHVTVEPVEGTILVRVVGFGADPTVAARLANTAATALVEQLNAPGPGVGTFTVQERAVPPNEPEEATSPSFTIALGLFAGAVFAAGTVGLILVLGRPVLSAAEAVDTTGAPLLGALPLPRRREVAPYEVPGVAALLSRLCPTRRETVLLVSVHRDRFDRGRAARLLARALARHGPARYVAVEGGQLPDDLPSEERGNLAVAALEDLKHARTGTPAVIDGPSVEALDVPQFLPGDAKVVLVAREGTRQPALAAAARQFLPDELKGILYLPRARQGRRRWADRARRRHGATSPTAGSGPVTADGLGDDVRQTVEPHGSSAGRRPARAGQERAHGGEDPARAEGQVGPSGLDA